MLRLKPREFSSLLSYFRSAFKALQTSLSLLPLVYSIFTRTTFDNSNIVQVVVLDGADSGYTIVSTTPFGTLV